MALVPSEAKKPVPHRWTVVRVLTDEGEKPLTRCVYCGDPKIKIEPNENIAQVSRFSVPRAFCETPQFERGPSRDYHHTDHQDRGGGR
jgi:hypothetical protein